MDRSLKLGLEDATSCIDEIIKDIKSGGFLDDLYLAQAYVRKELKKGWGPKIITLKLRRLGLDSTISQEAIRSEANLPAQVEAIRRLDKKIKSPDKRVKITKCFQRGFNGSAIFSVFDSSHQEE